MPNYLIFHKLEPEFFANFCTFWVNLENPTSDYVACNLESLILRNSIDCSMGKGSLAS